MSLTIPINQLLRFRASIKVAPSGNLTLQLDALSDGNLSAHPFTNIQAGIHFEASKDQREYIISICQAYPDDHGSPNDTAYVDRDSSTCSSYPQAQASGYFPGNIDQNPLDVKNAGCFEPWPMTWPPLSASNQEMHMYTPEPVASGHWILPQHTEGVPLSHMEMSNAQTALFQEHQPILGKEIYRESPLSMNLGVPPGSSFDAMSLMPSMASPIEADSPSILGSTHDMPSPSNDALFTPSPSSSSAPPESQEFGPKRRRRRFTCGFDGCERRFTSDYTRKVHMKTHEPKPKKAFPCTLGCPEIFSRQHDRLRHEVIQHGKPAEFLCPQPSCRRFFSSEKMLQNHKCAGSPAGSRWTAPLIP